MNFIIHRYNICCLYKYCIKYLEEVVFTMKNDELHVNGRNKAKDTFAWTILYGGTAAAKFAICTVGVAAGFVDKGASVYIQKTIGKMGPKIKKQAWDVYLETGSIKEMFDSLLG